MRLPLHRIAHSRAGDKGNHSNISLFAYQPEYFGLLIEQVTEERVAALFAARRPTSVRRYLLPNLHGMNFVLENALDGGVNDSLNLDMHGKSLSFLLLGLEVTVPDALVLRNHDGNVETISRLCR
ncbi:MAG: hypothetical protein A3G81_24390 [Betaproteobacteria bacterium RIFCSPLOWO2_12_FULL_65_14]|nr:MAG: hypothetical protein A3G81_24390 [Betaproteobacteria bacterium RIFCSPLOWO2_12_FULL_65_14]